jgi:putative iron-regulated protein
MFQGITMKNVVLAITLLISVNSLANNKKNSDLLKKDVINTYSEIAFANYNDSLIGAKQLRTQLKKFLSNASKKSSDKVLLDEFNKSKSMWSHNARMPYGQSEIFRFYNGPIDFEEIDDGITTYLESIGFSGPEGLLNAWPLDENYIDYVSTDMNTGLINDRSVKITSNLLVSMNERDGEKNISTGYHAIEFLLWGQDRDLYLAGQRPFTDFVNGGTAKNQDRRREFMSVLSNMLVDHLESVTNQWRPAVMNFRTEFINKKSDLALADIFVSMISMAGDELKSERIENAFLLEDQEEEQSCFSDKTINDIYTNYLGVQNIYLGEYTSTNSKKTIKGKGISSLVSTVSPALDKDIRNKMKEITKSITFFYNKKSNGKALIGDIAIPFDRAIFDNKGEIQKIIDGLDDLDELLREAAKELGLTLDV